MYHQKYHPFKTLYNHKFGFHINGPRQDAFDAVLRLRPRVVKTLDFSVEAMRRIREAIPDVFLIGRLVTSPQDFGQQQGAQVARQKGLAMAERILREEVNRDIHHVNGRPIFDAWESLNELFPEAVDADSQKLYDEYQVAFGEKMRAAGFEPIGMNFATGNFTGRQFVENFPGTLETYKYLGFHEYDWPRLDRLHKIGLNGPPEPHNLVPVAGEGRGNDGMWLCLRYRRILFNGVRQKYGDKHVVIITECSMTQGVQQGEDIGPWATVNTLPRDYPDASLPVPIRPDDYWQSLLWYNSELMKDDYVMGACLFVTGAAGKPEWETFEHLGEIMNRLAAFQQEIRPAAAPPPSTQPGARSVEVRSAAAPSPATSTAAPPVAAPVPPVSTATPAQPVAVSSTAAPTPPTPASYPKVIDHYLLFWHHNPDNWAEWDLISAVDYMGQFRPTIGFSVEEAKYARYVTIVGGPAGVPGETDQILRAAGCQVERLSGRTEEETNQMLYDLLAQGRQFRTLR